VGTIGRYRRRWLIWLVAGNPRVIAGIGDGTSLVRDKVGSPRGVGDRQGPEREKCDPTDSIDHAGHSWSLNPQHCFSISRKDANTLMAALDQKLASLRLI
jgi:hypothetical protein